MIRTVQEADAAGIACLYNHFIEHTTITFETQAVTEADMAARFQAVHRTALPWLVDQADGAVLGYAYATTWKPRAAYRHTVESTVYVHPEAGGRGVGSRLYRALLADLEQRSIHAVLSVVTLPNPASVALHEKLGFEKVGHLREVGCKFGDWLDVGIWQRSLETRGIE